MREVMDKMYMKEITSVYGLTETSPGMTQSKVDDPVEVRASTVGSDLPGVEVRVIDPETLEECPVGVQGEMCCRGYNIIYIHAKLKNSCIRSRKLKTYKLLPCPQRNTEKKSEHSLY